MPAGFVIHHVSHFYKTSRGRIVALSILGSCHAYKFTNRFLIRTRRNEKSKIFS